MSQLNVTSLKHGSSGVDNLVLDSSGNTIMPYGTSLAFNSPSNQYISADASNLYLGTGNLYRLKIDPAGRVTMPYQPAFEAGFNSPASLSDGSVCVFDWTGFNRGGHYSTSNGRFTAPINGVYQFQYSNNLQRLSGSSWTGFDFRINGSTYHICYADGITSWMNMSMSVLLNLQAGDYVTIVSRGGGSMSHDARGYGTFTGQLVG